MTEAMPNMRLPFAATNPPPTVMALDRAVFEGGYSDTTSDLVDADVTDGNRGFALHGDVTNALYYHLRATHHRRRAHRAAAACPALRARDARGRFLHWGGGVAVRAVRLGAAPWAGLLWCVRPSREGSLALEWERWVTGGAVLGGALLLCV